MRSSEILLQHDMFTGETVDARTASQKRKDKEREQPQQAEMFSPREVAQFGVNPRPQLPLSPTSALELAIVDDRSEEEVEEDRMRIAESLTYPLFEEDGGREAEGERFVPTIAIFLTILEGLRLILTSEKRGEIVKSPVVPTCPVKKESGFTTVIIDGVRVMHPL